jgi:hypothetical protein
MKRVVNSDMVAHLWAHQTQEEARNSSNSFFFSEDTIYSYGRHFPIARHANGVVLFTTRTYSVTTSRHISAVRSAARHLTVIDCANPRAQSTHEHQKNLQDIREVCLTALDKATRARVYTHQHLRDAEHAVEQHTLYRQTFGLSLDAPLVISEDLKKEAEGRGKAQLAIERERKKQKKIQEEQRLEKKRQDLEEWKVNTDYVYGSFYDLPVALRLSASGEEVQTSRGASIPVSHAMRLWGKVKAIQAGTMPPYTQNGHTEHAGVFAVRSIDVHGTLIAGCHTITFEAMQELAGKLGW